MSDARYFRWKSNCRGVEASDIKGPCKLEEPNGKFKLMVADPGLENQAIKDGLHVKR